MFKFFVSVLAMLSVMCVNADAAPVKKKAGSSNTKTTTSNKTNNKTNNNKNTNKNTSSKKTNAARAASTQKVVNTGTKISAAQTSNLVDEECQESYFGCMDAFCIVDNVSGGRCQCSNKHHDLMVQLNEIMAVNEEAYAIATYGTDHIEYGKAAGDVLAASEKAFEKAKKDAADESLDGTPVADNTKKSVSLDDWNKQFATAEDDEEEEEVFSLGGTDISDKTGDELYKYSMDMCWSQVPDKCKAKEDFTKMLYTQKIKGDCAAFENSIKQQKSESNAKLEEAKATVRTAALEDFKDSNKYDLAQCAIEFKNCLKTTAGCGEDFTGCVSLAASENMKGNKLSQVKIGFVSIAAATMDVLLVKKPMCETVLNNCVAVQDQVWDVVLGDIAFDVKNAELAAESNLRTNCLADISDCYLKACKEHMDPKDPDGSYDMCLSRPDNYKSFCKVQLEPCLNATGGTYEEPDTSSLWNGILSKLSSMRVDACTTEFKQCLQSDDRCGEDYSQCIGFDNDDIAGLCPEDKLTACYSEYNNQRETVRETLEKIANGILINVDNSLLTACQKAVEEAMVKVCGDTENCDNLAVDKGVGSRSLELKFCEIGKDDLDRDAYVNCKQNEGMITDIELGKTTRDVNMKQTKHERKDFYGVIFGELLWENIAAKEDASGITEFEEYYEGIKKSNPLDDEFKQKVKTEISALSSSIKNAISAIESDPKVQYCMTGRQVEGLSDDSGFTQMIGKEDNARFPNITQSYRNIIVDSALRLAKQNYYNKFDELHQKRLEDEIKISERISEIEGKNDKANKQDWARKACIALGEDASMGGAMGSRANQKVNTTSSSDKLTGQSAASTYNFKRSVITTFNMEALSCHKCVRTQQCEKTRTSYCKKWGDEQETCEDIQY